MSPENIRIIEEMRNATYVGTYDLPDREGPFNVFYQVNPPEVAESNYFGIFYHPITGQVLITDAGPIVDARFSAIKIGKPGEEEYLVSRYRHDYQSKDGAMIDGGLAYTRTNGRAVTHFMHIEEDKEIFEEIEYQEHT